MNVLEDSHYPRLRQTVEEKWGTLDILVHSLAFANKEDLKADFSETTREGFILACDVSAFSLVGLCNHLKDIMPENSSVMTMTYRGSSMVVPSYNIMGVAKAALEACVRYLANDLGPRGIRVNAISPGPIKTLAASGIAGVRWLGKVVEEKSPLRRNVTTEDVGGTAAYLASCLSCGVTGQIIYVDSGVNILAL